MDYPLPMYRIRTTKTSSAATAVQVVMYIDRKVKVLAHIGSAHNKEELLLLKKYAADWIKKNSRQQSLFPEPPSKDVSKIVSLDECEYLGNRYSFIYDIITQLFKYFDFLSLPCGSLFFDLALIRIIEPASKLRSLELLEELFGLNYSRRDFYRLLPKFILLKDKIESKVVDLAKREFNFDFSLVFYDVTTLYFESFKADELRKPGFSKDNKSQQPQILIGLIVDPNGFPVAYEIFEGNKFEGHTLIPIITAFKKKHNIEKLTVVADAAMISQKNIEALEANGLSYIVGARISNLSEKVLTEITSKLKPEDGANIRVNTNNGQLVCGFSLKRYRKDKLEMDKQLNKAQFLLDSPGKIKRAKFIKTKNENNYEINSELIEKSKLLLGIKGYYTNLPEEIDNSTIINHYHNLWHIEQAFRISKSDLETRPIYHFKQHTIQAHILICFMALAICKYMEIKTGKSTKQIIRLLKTVTDARILNLLTRKEIIMRSKVGPDVKDLLSKLNLSY